MNLTNSSTGEEIVPVAMAIHELVNRLPITMRTQKFGGVRIEEGKVLETDYTGPILEKVLLEGEISNETPQDGPYKGTPVIVVPLIENNEVIAAVGVIDTTKGIYSDIMEMTRRPEQNEPDNTKGEFY
ncbi:Uncharacterized conserved protein UCP006557, signal transduction [Methanobacterium lacus]|uniref:Uncharacterized conserved protein UCP006557, signal transduction n=1 Tax=Methanobacterium lacus (strain AL-21) TaxID=877455 RepID=F0TAR1_METLA|nr:DUF2111 domain-containing protein [Methanobacterium lacus]ADZ08937.1 Uncharacterized conserved protein UCP006557, signal transduction [Methanobacterium lacus]